MRIPALQLSVSLSDQFRHDFFTVTHLFLDFSQSPIRRWLPCSLALRR